jgi:hypothetical protein
MWVARVGAVGAGGEEPGDRDGGAGHELAAVLTLPVRTARESSLRSTRETP